MTQSIEKSFFHRAKYIEKKYWEKINISIVNWEKLFVIALTTNNAMYRDLLILMILSFFYQILNTFNTLFYIFTVIKNLSQACCNSCKTEIKLKSHQANVIFPYPL